MFNMTQQQMISLSHFVAPANFGATRPVWGLMSEQHKKQVVALAAPSARGRENRTTGNNLTCLPSSSQTGGWSAARAITEKIINGGFETAIFPPVGISMVRAKW